MMSQLLRSYAKAFLSLLFPELCLGCSRPLVAGERVLCLGCEAQLPETHYHHLPGNETELRFSGRVPFVRATSLAWYLQEGMLQHLIQHMKYRNRQDVAIYLGHLLGLRLRDTDWIRDVDVLVPVPLDAKKEKQRGYNQSERIAAGMAAVLQLEVGSTCLKRVKNTSTQTRKTRSERVTNMEEAFAVNHEACAGRSHVLLVDDVLTTGATMEACALALRTLPGIKISLVTIGIAVS